MRAISLAAICAGFVLNVLPATAEPQLPAKLQDGVASPLIVVGAYKSYTAPQKNTPSSTTYFDGVWTEYKVVQLLKNRTRTKVGDVIKVNYQFDDGSACIAPEDFAFNESMLPKPGSQWILLLEPAGSGDTRYKTYRGDFGRLSLNPENLKKTRDAMQQAEAVRAK